jgi:polar amino acid transport system substrate-binding protein
MKKFTTILLIAVLCIASVFAGGSKEKAVETIDFSSASLADLKAEIVKITGGTLTVLTSPDYAPYEFYAVSNGVPTLAGFDIALANYIADYLSMPIEFIPMDFDGILMEVQTKKTAIGISGFSPTEERAEVVDFSKIYYAGDQSFICLASNASKFKSLEDTNNANYTIAAQTGSIQVGLAEEFSPNADILQLTKATDIIAELIAGKIDGAYIETAVAESYKKNYPQIELALSVPFDAEGNVVLIAKGNDAMVEAVNRAIDAAIADGSMGKFVEEAGILASGEIIEGLLN